MGESSTVAETEPEPRKATNGPSGEEQTEDGRDGGNPLTESILDNLPAWAFIALAISALYLVWATLVIIGKYVGGLPGLAP